MTGQSPERPKSTAPSESNKKTSLAELVSSIFSASLDKDHNIKPASITKSTYKAISTWQTDSDLEPELADTLTADVSKTDPLFNALSQLMVAACNCRADKPRHDLIAFCIRLASNLWINKHTGSHNLFKEILDKDNGLDSSPLQYMKSTREGLYLKRIEGAARARVATPSEGSDKKDTLAQVNALNTKELESQRDNLLLIGSLWLMSETTDDQHYDHIISFLAKLLDKHQSTSPSARTVILGLAERFTEKDRLLADTFYFIQKKTNEHASRGARLAAALEHSKQETLRLKTMLDASQKENEENGRRIAELESKLHALEVEHEEQQLNERAKRTHLRDNTGQVKAKAFNLLTEDVLEPLKLSLAALRREKPKAEVAAHHVELAMESIEKGMKWFTE